MDSVTVLDSVEQELTEEQDMEVISVLKADNVETNAATGTKTASFKNRHQMIPTISMWQNR